MLDRELQIGVLFFFFLILLHSHLACIVSKGKSDIILILVSLQVRCFLPLTSFKLFSLFSSLYMTCLRVFWFFSLLLLLFVLPDILWSYWNCDLVSLVNFGDSHAFIFQMFCLFLSVFTLLLVIPLHVFTPFVIDLSFLNILLFFFFFHSLVFSSRSSLESFSWHFSSSLIISIAKSS